MEHKKTFGSFILQRRRGLRLGQPLALDFSPADGRRSRPLLWLAGRPELLHSGHSVYRRQPELRPCLALGCVADPCPGSRCCDPGLPRPAAGPAAGRAGKVGFPPRCFSMSLFAKAEKHRLNIVNAQAVFSFFVVFISSTQGSAGGANRPIPRFPRRCGRRWG